ncbi:MAG: hypothetical protein HYX89_01910 [Chloroflexi bacterium]|nr:hypothetical protein [Chloroflexota bacterium]
MGEGRVARRQRRKVAKAAAQPPAELALAPPIQTITPEPDGLATADEASHEEKPSRRRSQRRHHRRRSWLSFPASSQMVPWILFVIALMVIISLLIVVGERTIFEGFD